MKKVLSMVLVWVMVLTLIPFGVVTASAETASGITGDCTWTLTDGVLTISGNGAMEDYDSLGVLEDCDLGNCNHNLSPWMDYRLDIETVIIEEGVTNIGDYAFEEFKRLNNVTVSNSVISVGSGAFANCDNLYHISIPNKVTQIGKEAFSYCNNLTSIILPYTLLNVGEFAFRRCYRLSDIYYGGNYIDKQNMTIERGNECLLNADWHYTAYETLIKTDKDTWCYYVGGVKRDHTTLVKYKNKWFYVEDGVWDKNANTLVAYKGKGFYVEKGKWTKKTTLVKYSGNYSYVKDGIWTKATTLVKYKDKWFYVKNGVWKKDKLIFKYNGKRFYIEDGKVQFTYSGKVKIDGMYYNIKKGKVI